MYVLDTKLLSFALPLVILTLISLSVSLSCFVKVITKFEDDAVPCANKLPSLVYTVITSPALRFEIVTVSAVEILFVTVIWLGSKVDVCFENRHKKTTH